MQVIPFAERHVEDAAALVARRYARLRSVVPLLPEHYEDPAALQPLVESLTRHQTGVAAMDDGRLVGFLIGMLLPEFRGRRSIYSPEWGNAAAEDRSGEVYQRMYAALAEAWVSERCLAHYVSVFAHDRPGIEAWHWQSFGMMSVDAMRGVEPVSGKRLAANIETAPAALDDVGALVHLNAALKDYVRSAPIFLLDDHIWDRTAWEEYLHDAQNCVWLALSHGTPVAFMRIGPANPEACYVIRDPQTASITGAFTEAAYRSAGVATTLLNHLLDWARARGYERCAVDFEPMNVPGARFWLSHFQPFCFSMQRVVDDRLVPPAP
ncbi:MAG: GNAT family N-acetyltransferase [Anaerolineae bacterium]|nr:GNAT family N-acetyltransferase [Anaerolineae bacterium]